MARPEVLDKLSKILARTVANGASEAEAQSALVLAQRLMDEYGLSQADLNGPDLGGAVMFDAWEGSSASSHYLAAMSVVDEVFHVTSVCMRRRVKGTGEQTGVTIRVFGLPANVEAAAWALEFLATSFKHLWTVYRTRTGAPTDAMLGYFRGLQDGFLARTEAARVALERSHPGAGTALALRADAGREAMQAVFPEAREIARKVNNTSGYEQGYKDGQDINLARPIESGKRKALGTK